MIAKGRIGPFEGFRSKVGKPFVATIELTPGLKLEFDFGPSQADCSPYMKSRTSGLTEPSDNALFPILSERRRAVMLINVPQPHSL